MKKPDQVFKKIFFGFFLIIISIFLTSCRNTAPKNSTQKIRLNEVTRSIFYAPQYVAITKGFFEEQNLEIELSTGEGSDKTMTAILANQADIGLLGTSSIISVINQGRNNIPIVFAKLTERDGSFLIGREPNFSWESLQGKEIIAGRKGGVPEMVLEHILRLHGLTPNKDVKLLNNIQFNLMSVAFNRGIGNYVALFEPIASRLTKEKNLFNLVSLGEECESIPYTCYCATQKYISENPETIQKFTNAIYKAQKWINNHSTSEIAETVAEHFIDFDTDLLYKCIENYKKIGVWAQSPEISNDELQNLQNIMQEAGELDRNIDYQKVVDNSYSENAVNLSDN